MSHEYTFVTYHEVEAIFLYRDIKIMKAFDLSVESKVEVGAYEVKTS